MQRRTEARRQETGDAAGADGDRIFVNRGTAQHMQMRPNHGQTSSIERQQFGHQIQGAMNLNSNAQPCSIPGCQNSMTRPHGCHNSSNGCKNKVHNLCYQASSWGECDDNLRFYCSSICKEQKRAEAEDE